jgi:hypothetical protein
VGARAAIAAALLCAMPAAAGCRKPPGQEAADDADDAQAPAAPADDARAAQARPTTLPARCPKEGHAIALGDAGPKSDVELGDALETPSGYAVGFARREGPRVRAAVALLGARGAEPARVVELGPIREDFPAPWLALRSGELLAAVLQVPTAPDRPQGTAALTIYSLASEPFAILATLPQPVDDSMASDFASFGRDLFAVWDEAGGANHGVIRGAAVTAADPKPKPRDVSPPDSDAESPRILAEPAGYDVFWIARAPEIETVVDASEAIGETRGFGWVQEVPIDASGAARGPVRDLTPRTGHVSAYDVRAFASGSAVVVARDDGEVAGGSGGPLVRVAIHGNSVEPAQRLAVNGVGYGAPTFVDGSPPWLAWMARDEQMRVAPLDPAGALRGGESAEPAMSEARPVAVWPSPSGALKWLIASPSDPAGPLQTLDCVDRAAQ